MKTKRAFTLVEILVVIVIIGILVTLVAVAVSGAMRQAKRGRIAIEMSQIAMALERYKAEFGEYPPDMFDDEALVRHVKKRWPRLDLAERTGTEIPEQATWIRERINDAYGKNVNFAGTGTSTGGNLSSLGALALWLGGFCNVDDRLSGFGADPEDPFFTTDVANNTQRKDWVFDKKNLIDGEVGNNKNVRFIGYGSGGDNVVPVIGNDIRDVFVPVVYFRGLSSGGHEAYLIADKNHAKSGQVKQFDFSDADLGFCVPYAEEKNGEIIKWKNPTTFQLIHPGLDGKFGEPAPEDPTKAPLRIITSGANIGPQDLDDLTNFSDYKELKSILP